MSKESHPSNPRQKRRISSLASAAGRLPSSSPDGLKAGQSGPDHAHASLTHSPDGEKAIQTTATYGLISSVSLKSADLTQFLASRLKVQLGTDGLMEYVETWKLKVTPLGRQYWAHIASARRTSGNASFGWPTPQKNDAVAGKTPEQVEEMRRRTGAGVSNLNEVAQMAGWNTPRVSDGSNGGPNQAGRALSADAAIAGWPTPVSEPANGEPEDFLRRKRESVARGSKMGICISDLQMMAKLAGWRSPNAMPKNRWGLQANPEKALSRMADGHMLNLDDQAVIAGMNSPLSLAGTEKRGALNPLLALWLMGFPIEWESCADMVTPLSRKSRRSL